MGDRKAEFQQLIGCYIKAKDQNRPHLIPSVFADEGVLEMIVETDQISFPAKTSGAKQIGEVLVREFSLTYENIYTFCISDSIELTGNLLKCDWLVCMSDRKTAQLRMGWGSYHWQFNTAEITKTESLVINIKKMLVLDHSKLAEIMNVAESLNYPWCKRSEIDDKLFLPYNNLLSKEV